MNLLIFLTLLIAGCVISFIAIGNLLRSLLISWIKPERRH